MITMLIVLSIVRKNAGRHSKVNVKVAEKKVD